MSSEKAKRTLTVTACEALAAGVYSLTLQYREGEAPKEVRPGQFVGVYSKDSARILPRPISICGWDQKKRELRQQHLAPFDARRLFDLGKDLPSQ